MRPVFGVHIRKASFDVSFVHHVLPLLVAMAMKETIEEKLDRFIMLVGVIKPCKIVMV